MWRDVFLTASELQAFEPRLNGLEVELSKLTEQEISADWLKRVAPYLNNETVAILAFKLNELAGLYFVRKELNTAKNVERCAVALCTAVLGPEHADTKRIAANLQLLEQERQSSSQKLPPLRKFDRRAPKKNEKKGT